MSEPSNPIFTWIEKSATKKKDHDKEKKEKEPKPEKKKEEVIAEAEAVFLKDKKDKSERKPKEEKSKERKLEREKEVHHEAKSDHGHEKADKNKKEEKSKEKRGDAQTSQAGQVETKFDATEHSAAPKKEKKDLSSLIPKSPRRDGGSLRESDGSKDTHKQVTLQAPDVPQAAIDTSEIFLASDYVTSDAALAKEILAKARKPNDTVVGKVLLVYRKKEHDPCPDASHIVTIRYATDYE